MTSVVAMITHLPQKKIALTVFLLLSIIVSVKAQKIKPAYEDLYAEAEEYMLAGEYKEALPVYLNLYEKGYTTPTSTLKLENVILTCRDKKIKRFLIWKELWQKHQHPFPEKIWLKKMHRYRLTFTWVLHTA